MQKMSSIDSNLISKRVFVCTPIQIIPFAHMFKNLLLLHSEDCCSPNCADVSIEERLLLCDLGRKEGLIFTAALLLSPLLPLSSATALAGWLLMSLSLRKDRGATL